MRPLFTKTFYRFLFGFVSVVSVTLFLVIVLGTQFS